RALGEATSSRDSCLIALQTKQIELEKLNETLGLLARKDIDIQEGLKTKTYEISAVNQKHDELVKKCLLTRFYPNGEETVTLENESRSKLDKDKVKPYDYTYQNHHPKPILISWNALKKLGRRCGEKHLTEQNQTLLKTEIVDQAWFKHISDYFRVPTAKDMEVLIKTLLMPLSIKTQIDSFRFEHELRTEMHEDYAYVKSLEKEVDELESETADFSNIYDLLLEELLNYTYLLPLKTSLNDQKQTKTTESVNKEVHNKLLKSFAKLENHSISLELALQQCKEQMKNNSVCKENGSNVFRKEREQYHEIQDLKAQMQDKNIAISELKKLIEKCKGNVQRHTLKSYQVKDKVVPNNSQVKFNYKEVEEHHSISSISRKTKSVTACNDSLKSKTLNVNAVCAECGKCVFNSNHDACVSRYLNDVNARTKKPKVVPISARKPIRKAKNLLQHPIRITVASETTIESKATIRSCMRIQIRNGNGG
ncbi:hypothetical protein Tco_0763093, partial [Tanacetum coccineum]